MSSQNRKAAVKKLKTLIYNSKIDVNTFREKIEKTFQTTFLPNHVEHQDKNYGGITCDYLIPEIHTSKRILFYIHGGCFIGGSRASYRNFCATLANKAFSRVVTPEFRLAPSHPFPAALEDIQSAFRALFTEEQIARSLDVSAQNNAPSLSDTDEDNQPEIIIAADGSGASIAMALMLNLRERYKKCIKQIVFFSPWFNLSPESPLLTVKKISDEIMTGECLVKSAEAYTFNANLENPLISPVFAARELLENFPPVYVQIGEEEILLEDAKTMVSLLHEAGSPAVLDIWKNMPHNFQMADEDLSEAHDALNKFSSIISGIEKEIDRQTYQNKPKLEHSLHSEA